jgi:hypothetical protein
LDTNVDPNLDEYGNIHQNRNAFIHLYMDF